MNEENNNNVKESNGAKETQSSSAVKKFEGLLNDITNDNKSQDVKDDAEKQISGLLEKKDEVENDNGLKKNDILEFLKKPNNIEMLTKLVGQKYSSIVTQLISYATNLGISTKDGGLSKVVGLVGQNFLKGNGDKEGIMGMIMSGINKLTSFLKDSKVEDVAKKDVGEEKK